MTFYGFIYIYVYIYNLQLVKFESTLTNTRLTEKIINLAVTSRLDYCNSLLYGINGYLVSRLQRCQNNTARIVSLRRKYDHITPVLKDLHWLPVEYRINYKILLLAYKAQHGMAPPYCRPKNLGGLCDLRVNISWRHLVIAWKVLASVILRMPPLLSGTRSPSPSSVPSPLTFSTAIRRHICLISHIHNCDVTFLSYCVYFPSFCLVSVWYHKRFWAWKLVAVEIDAIENWHYYYYYYHYHYYYYYYNSLLYGINGYLVSRLQRCQNNAARIVSLRRKYDHITPVLKDLHWLPVEYRINYKILLLAYKAQHGMAPPYCRPKNLGGLCDLRVNISWRHLVIAWKVLASVILRMPPLLSGTRSPSPSSVPSPLTFSTAIRRHICLISHIHNCDVTFLSYCVYFPSFCLVSVWYHKRFWAWKLVAVEIDAIENWHYNYYYYHYHYYYYYYNSLLYGINGYLVSRLQRCQNNAARIVSLRRKYDHITPVLKDLHWLPVEYRINYKILLLAYKAQHGMAPPYCRPKNLGGLCDLRVNISWRHLVIAWKVLASVILRMPPLLSGTRSPSPSSVPSPLTFSTAIRRHICLISHIHNCDVTFLSYCVYFPSFCLVSVWYHKRFWAWKLVAVEIDAIENWHYYYYYHYHYYYYNSLLYGINGYLVSRLQRCQNNAARIVSLRRKYDHITPVLKDLHWLPVEYRINYKILLLAYKAQHGMAPPYCRPKNLGGLCDLRVNISWRHLVIAWKVLASVILRMPPLLSGTRSPSPSSVPSPLTFSTAIRRHIC